MSDIVYVLTNPAMPDLVKIGITSADVESRMGQLYSTGVPTPFKCEYAVKLPNGVDVEVALHAAFRDKRVNPKREFFQIDPDQVIAILKVFNGIDATPSIEAEINANVTPVEAESAEVFARKKRPKLVFQILGIPLGAVLTYRDGQTTVSVTNNNQVIYNGAPMSLTRATQMIKNDFSPIQPSPHWTYNGKTLKEYYEETYFDYYNDDE